MATADPLPNQRAEFLSIQISMAAVAVFFVALRLVSRFLIAKSPGWDDHVLILGTVECRIFIWSTVTTNTALDPWLGANNP